MSEVKECFGQLAHLGIRYIDQSRKHFLRVDEEKLKECDHCPLFSKCMFVKYNDIIKELLRLLDEAQTKPDSRPRLG